MKRPTQSDIDAAKKSAAAKGTFAALLSWEDLDAAVIVHVMTPREWAGYVDNQQRDVNDAREAAFTECVVWPPSAEADAMRNRIPALVDRVAGDLHEFAGRIAADPDTCRLTAETPPAKLARAGLNAEAAAELLTAYPHPQQLTIARFPSLDIATEGAGFSIVVKVPSKSVYRARLSVYETAKAEGSGVCDAAAQAARDFIVWTTVGAAPDPIFNAWPGVIAGDLITLFQKVGGAVAKGERRRL